MTEILDLISQYGVVPLLIMVIFWSKKEINELKQKLDVVNNEHKADLKQHAEEVKALVQKVTEKINTD